MELNPSIHNCAKCECSDGDVSVDVIRGDVRKKLPGGQAHQTKHWVAESTEKHTPCNTSCGANVESPY